MIFIKKLFVIFLILVINLTNVQASDTIEARIGEYYFDTLEEAILVAGPNDMITLTSDIVLDETLEINKTININLNNNTIEADEKVFLVHGGSLKLSGTGKVVETKPNYGAIMLKGSNEATSKKFSTVTVGSDVILEGWSGIFVNHNNKTAYGVIVNMDGTIKAVDDNNGSAGAGIYVNGNIKHLANSPIVNIGKTANITSTGTGIYAAGYATYNIDGAYISGEQSGLGIKSGIFNIKNSTIMGYGKDETPTSGNNNGINASGTAIQIESNSSYKGDIELNIASGTITSKYSNVIYEYTTNKANTKVKNINIAGGTYISEAKKTVFQLSNSFISNHPKFIDGGLFSSDPSSYLESGYSATLNDKSLYEVTLSTMQTFLEKETKHNNLNYLTITLLVVITLFIIIVFIK